MCDYNTNSLKHHPTTNMIAKSFIAFVLLIATLQLVHAAKSKSKQTTPPKLVSIITDMIHYNTLDHGNIFDPIDYYFVNIIRILRTADNIEYAHRIPTDNFKVLPNTVNFWAYVSKANASAIEGAGYNTDEDNQFRYFTFSYNITTGKQNEVYGKILPVINGRSPTFITNVSGRHYLTNSTGIYSLSSGNPSKTNAFLFPPSTTTDAILSCSSYDNVLAVVRLNKSDKSILSLYQLGTNQKWAELLLNHELGTSDFTQVRVTKSASKGVIRVAYTLYNYKTANTIGFLEYTINSKKVTQLGTPQPLGLYQTELRIGYNTKDDSLLVGQYEAGGTECKLVKYDKNQKQIKVSSKYCNANLQGEITTYKTSIEVFNM